MPIELPDLDDIDYDDLVARAIAALPGYGSDWTDYNPSDPGITILEMLAWLTEMLVYRTNRIQPQTYAAFLQLLHGYGESALREESTARATSVANAASRLHFEHAPLQTMREVLLTLRQRYRAVTAADYELLTLDTFPDVHPECEKLARVTCLTGESATGPALPAGAVSVIVVPAASPDADPWIQPSSDLVQSLGDFFEDRRMVTTHVCVAGPRFVELQVGASVYIDSDARPPRVLALAKRVLAEYLHPVRGGSDHSGWPFGRRVSSTDLTAQLANVDGVCFVEDVSVNAVDAAGDGESVALDGDQLPQLSSDRIALDARVLSGAMGQQGSAWDEWNPAVESA